MEDALFGTSHDDDRLLHSVMDFPLEPPADLPPPVSAAEQLSATPGDAFTAAMLASNSQQQQAQHQAQQAQQSQSQSQQPPSVDERYSFGDALRHSSGSPTQSPFRYLSSTLLRLLGLAGGVCVFCLDCFFVLSLSCCVCAPPAPHTSRLACCNTKRFVFSCRRRISIQLVCASPLR